MGALGQTAFFVALILVIVGATRLSPEQLKPTVTLKQVERDRVAAREMMR